MTSSHDKKVVVWSFTDSFKNDWQKAYLLHNSEVFNAKFIGDELIISQGKKSTNIWKFSIPILYKEMKSYMKNEVSFSKEEIKKYELFLNAE